MINLELRSALLASLSDLSAGDHIAVGVSGGADSLALLKATIHVGNERSFKVSAVVIDHQLQINSEIVANQAREIATTLGANSVEVIKVNVQTGPGSGGIEAAARNARRTAFEKYARENQVVTVLLGHTLEDQAETVLLGLARGSGARSLSGIRATDSIYRRPFLSLSRELVRSTVSDLNAYEDPHNSDLSFTRVRVRNLVLPVLETELGPGITDALARSAEMLRDDADALDSYAELIFEKGDTSIAVLEVLPKAVLTRVLRRFAISFGALVNDLSREHVLAIENLITNWKGQGPLNLPGKVNVKRESGKLIFYKP